MVPRPLNSLALVLTWLGLCIAGLRVPVVFVSADACCDSSECCCAAEVDSCCTPVAEPEPEGPVWTTACSCGSHGGASFLLEGPRVAPLTCARSFAAAPIARRMDAASPSPRECSREPELPPPRS